MTIYQELTERALQSSNTKISFEKTQIKTIRIEIWKDQVQKSIIVFEQELGLQGAMEAISIKLGI